MFNAPGKAILEGTTLTWLKCRLPSRQEHPIIADRVIVLW
jgi:hypothetical protein